MNKMTIPALLLGVVMIAGVFAFMPVQEASTVHNSSISSVTRSMLTTSLLDYKELAAQEADNVVIGDEMVILYDGIGNSEAADIEINTSLNLVKSALTDDGTTLQCFQSGAWVSFSTAEMGSETGTDHKDCADTSGVRLVNLDGAGGGSTTVTFVAGDYITLTITASTLG